MKPLWVARTAFYQVSNFASTIVLVWLVNSRYGSATAALISSAEIISGVLGAALLRGAITMEKSASVLDVMKLLLYARFFFFLLGLFLVLVIYSNETSILPGAIAALASVCLTPAYELLKTDYMRYGFGVLSGRLFVMMCLFAPLPFSLVPLLYFTPQLIAGALVWHTARDAVVGCASSPVLSRADDGGKRAPWMAFFFSLVLSSLAAVVSAKLIGRIALEGGLWVTVERVLRAGVAFSFPYFYRSSRLRSVLLPSAVVSVGLVTLLLVFDQQVSHLVDSSFLWMVGLPALLAHGVSWASTERVGSLVSCLCFFCFALSFWVVL